MRSELEVTAMGTSLRIASALLTLTLVPVAVGAQKVSYDFDRSTNFARLRSFALKPGTEQSSNPFVTERIANAISGNLSARGMSRTEENPDVYIIPNLSVAIQQEVTAYNTGYGPYGWYWGGGWGMTTYQVQNVQVDTLTIDMVDARTGELLWRGKGVREVNPNWKPEEVDKKVNKAVYKILKNFPPPYDDD